MSGRRKKYCKDYLISKKQFSIAKSQEDECVLSISKKSTFKVFKVAEALCTLYVYVKDHICVFVITNSERSLLLC